MASLKQSHLKEMNILNKENQFLQNENHKLKKKLGIKDDNEVIDIDSDSEADSEHQSNSGEESDDEKENRQKNSHK